MRMDFRTPLPRLFPKIRAFLMCLTTLLTLRMQPWQEPHSLRIPRGVMQATLFFGSFSQLSA